jgi:hypothetical protein
MPKGALMAKLTLTDDRLRGLAVLLAADRDAQPVYVSKATSDPGQPDNRHLTIRQQTVEWLRAGGYVTTAESPTDQPVPDGRRVVPTDRGLRVARQTATRCVTPDSGVGSANPGVPVPREAVTAACPVTAAPVVS